MEEQRKWEESNRPPSPPNPKSSGDVPGGSSSNEPSSGYRPMPGILRRVSRSTWLSTAALVLLIASLLWYVRLQSWDTRHIPQSSETSLVGPEWWSEPVVSGADAALPEISGRLYGVAVQHDGKANRVWVVGTGGFLAYSEDDGECWTPYEYNSAAGEFREAAVNPCTVQQHTLLEWPELVPRVYAAEQQQSSSPRQVSPAQNSYPTVALPTQQNLSKMNAAQQARLGISVRPTSIDFGRVSAPQDGKPAAYTQNITVSNGVGTDLQIYAKGLSGDQSGEFRVDASGCGKGLSPKSSCNISVTFSPGADGNKQVQLPIADSYSSLPTIVTIRALAAGFTAAAQNKTANEVAQTGPPSKADAGNQPAGKKLQEPSKAPAANPPSKLEATKTPPVQTNRFTGAAPRPPSNAPDLLAIGFGSGGEIVSTSGLLWKWTSDARFVFTPQLSGKQIDMGGMTWIMAGPPSGQWASETRVRDVDQLSESDPQDYTNLELRRAGDGTELRRRSGQGVTTLGTWPDSQLRSLAFDPDDKRAWIAGWSADKQGDHAVLLKADGDRSRWEPLTRGALPADRRDAASSGRAWMWMPRWYLAMLFLSLALAAPALLPPPEVQPQNDNERETSSVEARLSSDKPLSPGDRDVLGLTDIALGLSAFLRNEKTLPPLTVAINGEWGTGKSSLMNLLWCDLKSYGWCPVWFNAWHHQKEEHLLAALLQTVKLEAVPPWNLLGIPYRVRLLAQRFRRRWAALVFTAAAAIFLVTLDYHLRIHDHSDLFLWITSHILPSIDTKAAAPSSSLPVQGGLIAVITTIAALWKGLTAFGANPASLLASVAQGNKMKDLEAQTSFRQKFAVEFRDFTNALGERRPLVIFIDDLDRCLPGNVRDVLEAVNFLVSSGDCFVVLGMDRIQVQRAVGLSFKEVAEEAGPVRSKQAAVPAVPPSPQAIAEAAAEAAREKRAEFAQKYLEKLVNLEVRIPLAEDDKTQQGLFQEPPVAAPETLEQRSLRVGLRTLRWAVPTALALLLLWGAYHLSLVAAPTVEAWMADNPEPTAATVAPQNESVATAGVATKPVTIQNDKATNPAGEVSGQKIVGELIAPYPGPASAFKQGKEVWPARWLLSVPLYLAAVFLLLVANVVLTTRPGLVTRDSKQFTNAMEKVWYPLVLAKQNTPRAAKRFVNRVRYLAMRQRTHRESASAWERSLFPQRLVSPKRAEEGARIPEPVLVALAAMEQMEPGWIYDDKTFDSIVKGGTLPPLADGARKLHQELFADSKNSQWNCLPQFRKTFLMIWPRVAPEEAEEEARMAASG